MYGTRIGFYADSDAADAQGGDRGGAAHGKARLPAAGHAHALAWPQPGRHGGGGARPGGGRACTRTLRHMHGPGLGGGRRR